MNKSSNKILTIGIVLSTVPKYSETFFRNKIKGLQERGYNVILFVDYISPGDTNFPCKIVAARSFGKGIFIASLNSLIALSKSMLLHPKRSSRLFRLDKKDGVSFKNRLRRVILNQFLLTEDLDWLHFGFGMLAVDRENVATAIKAKMALSFRGFDLYLSPLKHPGCYKTLFSKDIKYHVLSEEMKQDLVGYGISKNKIVVITPAINVNFFQSDTISEQQDEIKLVTVARLHWKKGLEYTLEALAQLKHLGINFQYSIIGDGSQRERLVFAAYQLGIQEHVKFLGKLSPEEVKKELNNADVYLQYSIQEGFCNSVLEAQAMGLLCVVSNAEGLSENVLNGKTGWVVPKRNPKLLAQKIEDVIQMSSEEKENIREVAISRIREEFNLKIQNKAFVSFYED